MNICKGFKEALEEASEKISQLKGGRRVFFSSCSRKHKGISLLDGRKPCLLHKMAGGGHRGQREGWGRAGGAICR